MRKVQVVIEARERNGGGGFCAEVSDGPAWLYPRRDFGHTPEGAAKHLKDALRAEHPSTAFDFLVA